MILTESGELEDFRRYSREPVALRPEDERTIKNLHLVKRIVYELLLAESFLLFYLIDKLNEALSLL